MVVISRRFRAADDDDAAAALKDIIMEFLNT
jgi:hypothetical protein